MTKRIAILGAGFIGINLVEYFLEKGCQVNVLDRGEKPNSLTHPHLNWLKGDISDKEPLSRLLGMSDVVFYLVSSTVPGDDVDVSKELFVNVSQLLQVLELCEIQKVKQFLFFSSSSVYGAQKYFPISESAVPFPISAHGIQKLTMEYYIGLFSRRSDVDCKIVRLSNPYGPGQNVFGRQGFISIVIGHLIQGTPINIRGTGDDVRDYIYIKDVAEACYQLVETKSDHLIFNLGCGVGHSLNQVVRVFERLLGCSLEVAHTACRESDIPTSILSIKKINENYSFIPQTSLIEGIKTFLRHHELILNK